MGNLIRCEAGLHQFDADKYSLCPYCNSRNVDNPAAGGNSEVATRVLQRPAAKAVGSDDPTIPMNKGSGDSPVEMGRTSAAVSNAEVTRVLRTGGRQPITGWLVVIDGPGKGASRAIHHGVNNVGRDVSQGIVLAFAGEQDVEIARENQARITYDQKGNMFFLQHGEGKNLTYLNGDPVLELKTLKAYDRISIGKTELLFVPFCSDKFQWPAE